MHFQDEKVQLFFLQKEDLGSEGVNKQEIDLKDELSCP